MALTQPSFTSSTPTTTNQQHQHQHQHQHQQQQHLNLPPPQTFDILPALHELLARIDHINTTTHLSSTDPSADAADIGAQYTDVQPLDPKDLPSEVLALKAKIRRALKELEKLPDMGRSVEEQREEVVELEGRIRRQRGMVRQVGEMMKAERGLGR